MHKIVRSLFAPLVLAATIGAVALDAANAQDKKDKDKKATASISTAVFELYKDTSGKFRFRLKTGDGVELTMAHKGYENKADCLKVIDTIKNTVGRANVEDLVKK
jgi:uncharacterized protein YegP (UPF0339 family)